MRKNAGAINNLGVSIAAIVPTEAEQIVEFLNVFGPYPFPMFGDPEQVAYRHLGHKHMAKWKFIAMTVFGLVSGRLKDLYPKDKDQKRVVQKAIRTQDVYLQGGTWLFSNTGEVLWKHLDSNPTDHPSIEEIVRKINQN